MDAHEREANAAVAGMQEVYGRQPEHAIGDSVWFYPAVGAMPREAKVLELGVTGQLVVQDIDGRLHLVSSSQLAGY